MKERRKTKHKWGEIISTLVVFVVGTAVGLIVGWSVYPFWDAGLIAVAVICGGFLSFLFYVLVYGDPGGVL